jgi:hypothetical protein
MATDQNFDCGKIENDAGLKHGASNNMIASNTHTASTSTGIRL